MKLATGTVVEGKIVIQGEPLPEGSTVTVLSTLGDETFLVPAELEQELDESLAQAARGDTISVAEVIRRLSGT
jgi:hypothetical protein